MRNEFTAIIERDGDWHIAYCPEIPGANGQGATKDEARDSLVDAIASSLKIVGKTGSGECLPTRSARQSLSHEMKRPVAPPSSP
jgi:predicted RNase H-like HicB family nuclease